VIYNSLVTQYYGYKDYYNGLSQKVIDFCDDRGIDYHIKDGTFTEKGKERRMTALQEKDTG
jgi:hypothetical protein